MPSHRHQALATSSNPTGDIADVGFKLRMC
jgi:hypothetical protein